jgi:hypothetical protein
MPQLRGNEPILGLNILGAKSLSFNKSKLIYTNVNNL